MNQLFNNLFLYLIEVVSCLNQSTLSQKYVINDSCINVNLN